jgi:hypothetical protein
MGKPSFQTTIVEGIDGNNRVRNFVPILPCHIEIQVPGCPALPLGQEIVGKSGVVLLMDNFPGFLMFPEALGPQRTSLRPQP